MTKKVKRFTQAPLPFQGQKRRFLKQFEGIVAALPEDAVFVDLFGGSGLLSHTVKRIKPNATVVYNDYDNFSERLQRVDETNSLLSVIRKRLEACEKDKKVPADIRIKIIEDVEAHEAKYGYVDFITVSSAVLFSGKY